MVFMVGDQLGCRDVPDVVQGVCFHQCPVLIRMPRRGFVWSGPRTSVPGGRLPGGVGGVTTSPRVAR